MSQLASALPLSKGTSTCPHPLRAGIEERDIDTVLPLAEVIMCSGFFFICFLEELIHLFLHPHMISDEEKKREKKKRGRRKQVAPNLADPGVEESMDEKGPPASTSTSSSSSSTTTTKHKCGNKHADEESSTTDPEEQEAMLKNKDGYGETHTAAAVY